MVAAAALNTIPDNDQIVVAVRLVYQEWEDTKGLPSPEIEGLTERVLRQSRALPMALVDSTLKLRWPIRWTLRPWGRCTPSRAYKFKPYWRPSLDANLKHYPSTSEYAQGFRD